MSLSPSALRSAPPSPDEGAAAPAGRVIDRHTQVLWAIATGLSGWMASAAIHWSFGRSQAALFSVLGGLSGLLALPRTDRLRPRLAAVVVAMNVVAIFGIALESGGTSAPVLLIFAPVVLGVALMIRPLAGALVTAGACLGILGLEAYQGHHAVGSAQPFEHSLSISLALIASVTLGVLAHRIVQAERATAERQALEARSLANELRVARDRQDDTARRKANFYATMSHEVRTPLGGLLGLMTALEGTELDAAQREVVEHMRTSGEALRMLVNDMLDLEAFERGLLRIEEHVVDARAILDDVMALYAASANAKGVALVLSTPTGLPPALAGDPLRLRQILQNLVSNALKFTEQGEVALEATYADGALRCCVRDTGRGIPADRLGAIFRPFEQSDPHLARVYGGSGLGLAIVKHLLDAMGGTICVESEVGRGTTFTLRVPLAVLDEARAGVLGRESVRGSRADAIDARHVGLRALIVDDDRINRFAASLVLRRFGVICEEADSGLRALALLGQAHFDVAFLDLHMPEMQGTELAEHILALPARPPYLVALSGAVRPEDRVAALASGISEFLPKPLDVRALASLLDRVPRRSPTPPVGTVTSPATSALLRASRATPLGFDRELDRHRLTELRELTGDRGEFEGLIRSFLQQLSVTVLELEKREADMDAATLRALAHRLRGSGMNVGAGALAAAAATAEQVAVDGADPELLRAETRELVAVAHRAHRAMSVLITG